jgi:hypothetical protein
MITRLPLARWISIAGHPFSFTALLVVVAGSKSYGVGEEMRLIGLTSIVRLYRFGFSCGENGGRDVGKQSMLPTAQIAPPFTASHFCCSDYS